MPLISFTPKIWVTPTLVALNALVFVAISAVTKNVFDVSTNDAIAWGANYGPKTIAGEWWRLFTSMFLHFGIIHFGFNMWILYDSGKLVERLLGNAGFLLTYVVSGLAGSLMSLAWNANLVSAGASGAIFGVIGALLGFLVPRRNTVPPAVLKHLRSSVGSFLFINVLFGVQGGMNVDWGAHVGGLIAGFLCGLLQSQPLTFDAVARRSRRNLITAFVATAALILSACLLPAAPIDVSKELTDIGNREDQVLNTYNEVLTSWKEEKITGTEAADRFDREVSAPWTELLARIERVQKSPMANQRVISLLSKYMQTRGEAFTILSDAARNNSADGIARFNAKWTDSEAIIQKLEQIK